MATSAKGRLERAIVMDINLGGTRIAPNKPQPPGYLPASHSLRAAGPLVGRVLYFNEASSMFSDGYHYRFEPGAFASGASSVDIRDTHSGEPFASTASGTLSIGADALGVYFEVREADTTLARTMFALVCNGKRRGVSARFVAQDYREEKAIRTVSRAKLRHIALVDSPAFERSWIAAAAPSDDSLAARVRSTELARALADIRSSAMLDHLLQDDDGNYQWSTPGVLPIVSSLLERRDGGGLGREPVVLAGYAARFNSRSLPLGPSGFREEIDPGAFDETLAANADVRFTFNHDPSKIFGRTRARTLRLWRDQEGLAFEASLAPGSRDVVSLAQAVQRGDVSQCSFAFRARKDAWTREQDGTVVRRLLNIDLDNGDVAAVTFPAYPSTSVDLRRANYGVAQAHVSRTHR